MTKHLIALAVVVSAAHAADATVGLFTPLPSTLRSYVADNGQPQLDMEWQAIVDHQPVRVLIAVTGCEQRAGYLAMYLATSTTPIDVQAWTTDGTRVHDGVASKTCALARPTNGGQS